MEKDKIKIRLLFTRHGETEENQKGIICGQQPGTLTNLGRQQAKKIGQYLAKENMQFDHIYVSDLKRAVDTFQNAKSEAKYLDKIPVTLTPILRQKAGGVLEGKALTTWKQEADKEKKNIREYKCSKGENWLDVNKRCFNFLELLIENHILKGNKDKDKKEVKILAVAHGGFLMEFHNLVRMIMLKEDGIFKNTAKNCSFHEFEIQYPNDFQEINLEKVEIKCVRENFIDHLK